jgi:hypothetical protein
LLKTAPGRQVTLSKRLHPSSLLCLPGKGRNHDLLFFINAIFANVIALITVMIGLIFLYLLPVAQYPQIVPPTIQVSTRYPGASAIAAATIGCP